MTARFILMAAVVIVSAAYDAAAADKKDDPRARLKQVEQDIARDRADAESLKKRAAELAAEIEESRAKATAAARKTQDSEREMARLESEIAQAVRAEAGAEKRLTARRAQAAEAVMALQRLALHPPEALLAQPAPPSDTVRSGILLRAAVPAIERRAAEIRADLDAARTAREQASARRAAHALRAQTLLAERRTLEEALVRKASLQKETVEQGRVAEKRLAALAAEAQGLNELMARLETERARQRAQREAVAKAEAARAAADKAAAKTVMPKVAAPAGATAFAKARGRLPPPAVGQVVLHYGQTLPTGLKHKGVTLETQKGSTVIAPFSGYVVFAGEFRGYGQLLILDHGDGYHTLLAGLDHIDGVPGLWVETGEPVGVMGQSGGNNATRPRLYVEIRQGGQPVDPLPWLAAGIGNSKVSG
ncbi:MAG: hypothetical protein FJX42_04210 [Alphaproteobacteria bacterium]|nr:hypothetical protein [Alphaproteobacteria bacterium]